MIPYLEIKEESTDKYTLKTVALVEPQECWLELSYQDVGAFEIYCRASKENLAALKKGRFVTIPNKRFIWFITSIRYKFSANGARMIIAGGYEAKWLLKRRCILMPKELQGKITSALYALVEQNIGTKAPTERQIKSFTVDTNELLINISGTQAARGNLLEFANALLKSYNCGSIVELENGKLKYRIFTGDVKTSTVIFSQSLDNLLSSEYLTDDAERATNVTVVSTVDDVDYSQTYDETYAEGIDRAEILVESNISTKYEDANGVEKEANPNSDLYQGWLKEEGKNKLGEHTTIEEASGEIDISNSKYRFDEHFFLGDIARVQDEYFNFYINTKISKYTFKQSSHGLFYSEEAEYGG